MKNGLNILSQKMKKSKYIRIEISVAGMNSPETNSAHFLGNDLSYDYVKINAEYTT